MSTSTGPLDVLIVGTGFSGTYLVHRLLNLNYRVLALDASPSLGGVWNSNTYPGARVDIQVPEYQLSLPELSSWQWKERFPGREELQAYFAFAEKRLGRKGDEGLAKHCTFGVWVEGATWHEQERLWEVRASDGRMWRARWFLPCVGYAARPFVPDWKGFEAFEGVVRHTAKWGNGGEPDVKGKKVGVVGTGASGVQVVQTIAPEVESLTVFQQTPALAVPMRQRAFDPEFSKKTNDEREDFFANRKNIWDGSSGSMIPRAAKDETPEQRVREFDRLWDAGGFAFWSSNYMDMYVDRASNAHIYAYWRDRVRQRVHDPTIASLLAPSTPPHPFGTKRVPLEQTYFESFNLPNVSLVSLPSDPITSITPSGVLLQSGTHHALDILILATGFDVGSGSFTQLSIRGVSTDSESHSQPLSLSDLWITRGPSTYLGLATSGFPNMLFPYGPQSPSGTCNGPLCAEIQGDWMVELLEHIRAAGKTRVEAKEEAQAEWTEHAGIVLKGTLFEETRSYFWGQNVPGKKKGLVYYFGGVPAYLGRLEEEVKGGYPGLRVD
ncbi:cyclopentanone monooxygenase [Viridothelium virens]|uniref:L-ornithine N(5)-monooxygenase [NAD(P)H] n=1 Tax=Viridothelium virens TaxID=1048519 RepID=A0A6A6HKW5_VIRVR|nr:cyclopentanone monooxygenase [Viridothelium virens]